MGEYSASARNRDAVDEQNQPASADQRRAVIEGVCRGQGWRQSRREQLTQPCQCGAAPGSWCRRRVGQPVVGFIHPGRGTPEGATRAEPATV